MARISCGGTSATLIGMRRSSPNSASKVPSALYTRSGTLRWLPLRSSSDGRVGVRTSATAAARNTPSTNIPVTANSAICQGFCGRKGVILSLANRLCKGFMRPESELPEMGPEVGPEIRAEFPDYNKIQVQTKWHLRSEERRVGKEC